MHTSIEPKGCYLYSNATLNQAQEYLELLRQRTDIAGNYLKEQLNSVELLEINAQQLIVCLMNTRKPLIFAESEPVLNGTDWNEQETSILGGVSFSTTGTHSYNNGAWGGKPHVNHLPPIHTNFIFVAGALLRNDKGTCTADMAEVLSADKINEEAFYRLYERRLLPGLLMQNQQAKNDGVRLVINIPGIGCGQFAGTYQKKVRAALPRVLKKLFTNYAQTLDMVNTVNFDPFVKPELDEFFAGTDERRGIRLMQRPSQGLFAVQEGTIASQLEFPKDGSDYSTGFRLLKIVAWDHFSFPGNDIWGDSRSTDDGASFASSDVILAMLNAGQFATGHSIKEVEYDSKKGIVYAKAPDTSKLLTHGNFKDLYPSEVTEAMLKMVDVPQVAYRASNQNPMQASKSSLASSYEESSFFARPVVKSGGCTLVSALAVIAATTALICSLTPMGLALIGLAIAAICLSASLYRLYNDLAEQPRVALS